MALFLSATGGMGEDLKPAADVDYESVPFEELVEMANGGDAGAQHVLFKIHMSRKQFGYAFRWCTKAALQGHVEAQYHLGAMYANDQNGVPRDHNKVYEWHIKAAKQGYAPAQVSIGYLYAHGLGVPPDDKEALAWYLKAAEQGNSVAQANLGLYYLEGRGTAPDLKTSIEWYRKAAEQGDERAKADLERFEPALAYPEAAAAGDAEAQFYLGLLYTEGRGFPKDPEQAFHWNAKAAEQGHAKAQCNMGAMYAKGLGTAVDHEKAFDWYLRAAGQGVALALHNLGVIFQKGEGRPKNMAEAYALAKLAAEIGPEYTSAFDLLNRQVTASQLKKGRELFQRHKAAIEAGEKIIFEDPLSEREQAGAGATFSAADGEDGLTPAEGWEKKTIDGEPAVTTSGKDLHLKIDDQTFHDLPADSEGRFRVTVEIYDHQKTWMFLYYDGQDDPETKATIHNPDDPDSRKTIVVLTGSGIWKTVSFNLPGAKFANRQKETSDFRLNSSVAGGLILRKVQLQQWTTDK
ncbi:MAG: tetratricopeptide repeat protein [Verrucomicrobiota bacterium]